MGLELNVGRKAGRFANNWKSHRPVLVTERSEKKSRGKLGNTAGNRKQNVKGQNSQDVAETGPKGNV